MTDFTRLGSRVAAIILRWPRHNLRAALAIIPAVAVTAAGIAAIRLTWRQAAPLTMIDCSAIVKVDEEWERDMIESVLPPLDSDQDDIHLSDRPFAGISNGNVGRYELLVASGRREFDRDRAAAALRRIDRCISNYSPMSSVPLSFVPDRRMVILLNAENKPVAFVGAMNYENWMFVSRSLTQESKNICVVDARRKGTYCYVNDPILHKLLFE